MLLAGSLPTELRAEAQLLHNQILLLTDPPVLEAKASIYTPLEQMFIDEFGEDWKTMYEIAKAESNLVPTAYNPEWHKGCQGSRGIMQIGCVNYSGNQSDLFDIKINLKVAHEVYKRQGFNAWTVCRTKVKCLSNADNVIKK